MLSLTKATAIVAIPVLAVGMAACSSNNAGSSTSSSAAASVNPTPSVSFVTTTLTAEQVQVSGPAGQQPTVTFPTPSQAQQLSTRDTIQGKGKAVTAGDTVTVNYIGIGAASGQTFDSSWERGQPASFPISGVITGWQEGIPGMKPGTQRVLVIPGAKAYGDGTRGPLPPGILPNETLIFVVDMISAQS